MMDFKNLPSTVDLLRAATPKPFHIAITGHVALERVINVGIMEELSNGDAFDLERVPFNQKIALAAALGILEGSSIPAYKAINSLRNKVAHDLILVLDATTIRDLRNCLSASQRKALSRPRPADPVAALREILGVLYGELKAAVELRREKRLRAAAYNDITAEALMGANYGNAWVDSRRALEEELSKRVTAKKKKLGWTYKSPVLSWDIYEFEFVDPRGQASVRQPVTP